MKRVFIVALIVAMVAAMAVPGFALPSGSSAFDSPAFTSPDRIGGGSPSCDSSDCQGGAGGIFPIGCTLDPVTYECVQPVSTPGGAGVNLTYDPLTDQTSTAGGGGGVNNFGEGSAEPGGGGVNCLTGISGCVGTGITGGPA